MQEAIDKGWFRKERQLIAPNRPDMETILASARDIAEGMAFLHARDVVHGDLTGGEEDFRLRCPECPAYGAGIQKWDLWHEAWLFCILAVCAIQIAKHPVAGAMGPTCANNALLMSCIGSRRKALVRPRWRTWASMKGTWMCQRP